MAAPSLTKTTRPRANDMMPRPRLFGLLDAARRQGRLVWVDAPAGSGKTMLVASYVGTRKLGCLWYRVDQRDEDLVAFFEHVAHSVRALHRRPLSLPRLPGVPGTDRRAFTRHFFSQLFRHIPHRTLLVFDDCHEVASDGPWSWALRDLLATAPDGTGIICLSRAPPPPTLAREIVHRNVLQLEAGDLALTDREASALARRQRGPRSTAAHIRSVRDTVGGWMAGFLLLLRHDDARDVGTGTAGPLFDYLAFEVFAANDADTQRFLCGTALLPVVRESLARKLVSFPDCGRALRVLRRQSFLVRRTDRPGEGEPSYEYHPLLRDFFLGQTSQLFTPGELRDLRRKAAALLASEGELGRAMELYREIEDWAAITELIVTHAPRMLAAGRHGTLWRWLDLLPADRRSGHPWLLYFGGLAATATASPATTIDLFERAYAGFEHEGNALGMRLAAAGVVIAECSDGRDLRRVDRWACAIERLQPDESALGADIELIVTHAMVSAMALRGTRSSRPWTELALAQARQARSSSRRLLAAAMLLYYHGWAGDTAKLALVDEKLWGGEPTTSMSPVLQAIPHVAATFRAALAGDDLACLSAVRQGLAVVERTGMKLWTEVFLVFGVLAAVALEDYVAARQLIGRFSDLSDASRGYFACCNFFTRGLVEARQGEPAVAEELAGRAVAEAEQTGSPNLAAFAYLLHYAVLLEHGKDADARERRRSILNVEQPPTHRQFTYWRLVIEAHAAYRRDQHNEGARLLTEAFALGRAAGLWNAWLPDPKGLAQLAARALEAGIEVEYARTLIARRSLRLEEPPQSLRDWPWPLRFRTLGRFEVLRHGEPAGATGRGQRTPTLLLQALLGLGGLEGRPVSVERLADLLWPDADGDAALHALETTVYRLRRHLGIEEAVVVSRGRMSLNPAVCWVDLWALRELTTRAERAGPRGSAESLALASSFEELDDGPFLGADHPVLAGVQQAVERSLRHLRDRLQRCRALGKA